ncbi:MAG: methyltransferase domain-containing protein [Myxococcota bacterium]
MPPSENRAARYDRIGESYGALRREDPFFRERIHAALGDARSVVNVGAGTGSYEPRDRHIVAVEPSDVMAGQRPRELAPAIQAWADHLPLRSQSVDAAMAILSLHHWDGTQREGVAEMRRVARGPVVIMTYDPRVSSRMWLMADYLPELAELDRAIFPEPEEIAGWLGRARIETLPIPGDTPDRMLGSFWRHPERVLDPRARQATSGFARQPESVIERVVTQIESDLRDGTWDRKYGHLRTLSELDVGLRLIAGDPTVEA